VSSAANQFERSSVTRGPVVHIALPRRAATEAIAARFHKSGIYVFVIASVCLYYLPNAQILLGHYDLGWHLAAGDLIRAQGKIPFQDPWSFTSAGKQWLNLSWLWDVFASALFQYAHFSGVALFVIACGGAIAGYLASLCLGNGASATAACIAVLSACLLYPAFAAFPNIYLAASPNVATMLFSVIFYGECLKRSRRLFWLPAMMLLWANLHGGFLLGLFIVGFFCGLALLKRDWAYAKIYALVGCGCFLATFINPLGLHIYEGVTATVGNFVQAQITEWLPYTRNITLPGSIPGMLYILAFAGLELRGKSSCPLEARLLSWLFLFLGFYQFRYLAFFFLFSAVPLSLHLSRLLPKLDDLEVKKSLLVAGAVMACALPLVYAQVEPALGLPQMLSERDVSYLQTHYPHARLLNHWNYGGILLFHTHGAIPVFVDGRASTAYPNALLRDYFALGRPEVNDRDWDAVLGKYHINTVLWVRTHGALRQFLVGRRGWKEAYTGMYASLYVKP